MQSGNAGYNNRLQAQGLPNDEDDSIPIGERKRRMEAAAIRSLEDNGGLALIQAFNYEDVKPWEPGAFETLKKLQDATRNHGEVFLMRDVSADELVAVKKMPNNWIMGSHEEFLHSYWYEHEQPWQDIGTTKYLNDAGYKYACDLKGVYRDESHTYVVTSFCDIGDMFNFSLSLQPPGLDREIVVRPIIKQILESVQQLHDLSIVHLDLSLENILLKSIGGDSDPGKMTINLIDFAQSKGTRLQQYIRGKPTYQAPEMHMDGVSDGFLTDVFALGVVLYSMMLSDYPWRSTRPDECKCYTYVKRCGFRAYLAKRKLRDRKARVADCISEPLMQLLEGMLAPNPRDRLTLGERIWTSAGRESVWDKTWLGAPDLPAAANAARLLPDRLHLRPRSAPEATSAVSTIDELPQMPVHVEPATQNEDAGLSSKGLSSTGLSSETPLGFGMMRGQNDPELAEPADGPPLGFGMRIQRGHTGGYQ